jgi:predicted RNA binding protein YcfA (HicA-like mRNA interferase family)
MARMPQVTAQDLVRFLKSQGFLEIVKQAATSLLGTKNRKFL